MSLGANRLHIVAAFVTEMLLRALKHSGGFKVGPYEFVATCRSKLLVPICRLGSLIEALEAVVQRLELSLALPSG
jgi:hypothetical protein